MRLPRAIFQMVVLWVWLPCLISFAQSDTHQHDSQGIKGHRQSAGGSGGARGAATGLPLRLSNDTEHVPGNWSSGYTVQRELNLPLALAGYDSVYLKNQQKWKLGLEAVAANYDGQRYLFFSERQRAIFLAAPDQYVPALGGQCVVTYVESGQRVPGDLKFGVLYQNRIYLFAGAAKRNQFQDEPDGYRDADLANAGNCPVTLLQEQRSVFGVPATLQIHAGFRYWFANSAAKKEFLKSPSRYMLKVGQLADPQKMTGEHKLQVERILVSNTRSTEETASQSGPLVPEAHHSHDGAHHLPEEKRLPSLIQNRHVVEDETLLPSVAKLSGEKPAMGGFCPVSIQGEGQDLGIWVEGKEFFRTKYDGKIYQFASARKKQQFLAAPEQYIPAFGGACAVCQQEHGTEAYGSIYHAAIYLGRLFLFTDEQHKGMFKQNPAAYY